MFEEALEGYNKALQEYGEHQLAIVKKEHVLRELLWEMQRPSLSEPAAAIVSLEPYESFTLETHPVPLIVSLCR